ncbi:MAG TPA: VOC family protein [Candidatus Binatia bacterium]|nr:VOC family protein [Candidatus Binatia bacterium]
MAEEVRPERLRFDSVQIGGADPDATARAYALLLGLEPVRLHSGALRFQLDRGAVDVVAGAPGLRSLSFACAEGDVAGVDFHGLDVRTTPVVAPHPSMGRGAPEAAGEPTPDRGGSVRDTSPAPDAIRAIDHVVIASSHAERAIALWRDRLGLRQALDREFPERGLRMLFFRTGGVTLEIVTAIGAADASARDLLNGVAYEVADLAACRARLLAAGLDVSGVRDGNKRGTRVATVRSRTEGVPTLLIEHVDRAAWRADG